MVGLLEVISVSATVASVCMVGSPVITVNNMRKANSIGVMTITFFCAQFLNCNVWAMYGAQMQAAPVIICNTIGGAIAAYCILTFLTVARIEEKSGHALQSTTYRAALLTAVFTCALVVFIMLLMLFLMNYKSLSVSSQLNGIMGGFCSVFMLSSPLGMAKDIIKNKNAESLQPVTVVFATLNSVLWTLYGVLKLDVYIALPNALCTLACIFQAFLLLRYGRHPSTDVEATETLAPVPIV
ncbi:Sugar efflux transporter for intercellular exchange [Lotmaria passim]